MTTQPKRLRADQLRPCRAATVFGWRAWRFTGNKYFGKDLLDGRLSLQPASFALSGRFSQSLVRDDVNSIRALYLSNGFRMRR